MPGRRRRRSSRRPRDRTGRRRSRDTRTSPVAAASAGRRTTGWSPAASDDARHWPADRRSGAADDRPAAPPVRPARGSWCERRPARWRAGRRRGGGRSPRRRCGWPSGSNVGEAAAARSLNSSTPDPPGSRGATATSCSSRRPRPSLEVASTRTFGQPSATARARSAAPSMTCSQLSRTSSARRDCSAATIDAVNVLPRLSFTFRTLATARGTSLDEPLAASSMSQAPPLVSTSTRCATARASLVLPIPPGPTSVTIGDVARAPWMVSSSSSRPISRPRRCGRFPPRLASIRNGGCSPSPSWTMRCSATTPSRRNVPRSRRSLPVEQRGRRPGQQRLAAVAGGREPRRDDHGRTEVALPPLLGLAGVQADPNPDGDVRRATVRGRSRLAARWPIRRRRWLGGRPRRTSRHRWRRRSRRDDRPPRVTSSSWRAIASAISRRCAAHSRVESSTSEIPNVTVPDGRPSAEALDDRSTPSCSS